MEIFRIEGIVIKTVLFQDYDRILTVFTPERGVVKFMLKGADSSKRKLSAMAAPFTQAEFVYRPGKGEIAFCREISPINQYLFLRENYAILEASSEMLNGVFQSQWNEKSSYELYSLLIVYLNHINEAANPYSVSSSFLLKMMKHEGLLHLGDVCEICRQPLQTWNLSRGDTFCQKHSPPHAVQLSFEEALMLTRLATSRSLKDILTIDPKISFREKIKILFKEAIG